MASNVASQSSALARQYWPARKFRTETLQLLGWKTSLVVEGGTDSKCETCNVSFSSASVESSLRQAAEYISSGGLVAFPTETVYGLGGSALSDDATRAIFAAKGRPADNPLIVHVADVAMLRSICPPAFTIPPSYEALISQFWPGPLTLLFPVEASNRPTARVTSIASAVTCGHQTVAVRMPAHPVARALIALSGRPLAAPSANLSGRPSPTSAEHVSWDLGEGSCSKGSQPSGRVQYILDGGPCDVGVESTVVDGITAPGELRILRPGGISVEAIEELLADTKMGSASTRLAVYGQSSMSAEVQHLQEAAPTTPGMKYKHYSPNAPVVLAKQTRIHSQNVDLSALLNALVTLSQSDSQASTRNSRRNPRIGVMMATDSWLLNGLHSLERVSEFSQEENSWRLDQGSAVHLRDWSTPRGDSRNTKRFGQPITLSCACRSKEQPFKLEMTPFSLGPYDEPAVAAQRLFEGLRSLDEDSASGGKCEIIVVETQEEEGVWFALLNRLRKAASLIVNL